MNTRFLKPAIVLPALVIFLASCDKKSNTSCPPVTTSATASEVTRLEQYLTSANISAAKDDRGFYYSIKEAGSGDKPTACATVKVAYRGRFTSGEEFDSSEGVEFPLGQLIAGWQEGIPLIAPGGSVTLYLPPSLAYGEDGREGIPGGSMLIFDIDLLGVE